MSYTVDIETSIIDTTVESILWRATSHLDIAVAIFRTWPSFQTSSGPHTEEVDRTPATIWQHHASVNWAPTFDDDLFWLDSHRLAQQAIIFHYQHYKKILTQLVQVAQVSRLWYRTCQAWRPGYSDSQIPSIEPLHLNLYSQLHPRPFQSYDRLPIPHFLSATDRYIRTLAEELVANSQGNRWTMDPEDETSFPLLTINYYRGLVVGNKWYSYLLLVSPKGPSKLGENLAQQWFEESYPIDHIFPGQIPPRYLPSLGTW